MIGLESNTITIDIHESKVPLSMVPDRVEIFHDRNILHDGKIDFNSKSGEADINIASSRDKFDEVFNSAGRYMPFTFKFFANSNQMMVSYDVEGL